MARISPDILTPPDLTGATTGGSKGGVPGGATTTPGGSVNVTGSAAAAAQSNSINQLLQQGWRPDSLVGFHKMLLDNPQQASRDLDTAIQRAYNLGYTLQTQIACTQVGSATVTGSVKGIPTGLVSIRSCTGSIDNGSTAHNFWVSVSKSATPGAIDIAVFKPTAANDNTPIPATTPVLIRWSATGSLSTGT